MKKLVVILLTVLFCGATIFAETTGNNPTVENERIEQNIENKSLDSGKKIKKGNKKSVRKQNKNNVRKKTSSCEVNCCGH